ncbi:NAD-dependent epimerase/dehydratase family protein [Oligoflexus tunisiensis]|uniref:NAD-dependent epimerase/dehydratase family protein n=1 Tax=Oligoflexus tunisiensis TaxID=708132 RepID=UPI00114D0047|nr:NAD-dependent epimerase/dehydratase family protein [Oligoflexus tunisiensis]
MSTVLIIGAGTFFGQQLGQQFVQAGWKVLACSRRQPPAALSGLPIQWIHARFQAHSDYSLRPVLKAAVDAEVVIHAGGFQGSAATHAALYEEHVVRTATILHFCRYLPRLKHYYHTSTVRVAGRHAGVFAENTKIPEQTYADAWAGAQFAAEKLVQQTEAPFARSVVRLGEIIGSTATGEFPRISGMYHILQALYRLKSARLPLRRMTFLPFVFSEATRLPLLPVDRAAQAYQQLVAAGSRPSVGTWHILGGDDGISARKVLAEMMAHVGLDMEPLALPYDRVPKAIWKYFHMPLDMLATLNSPTHFQSTHLQECLPTLRFPHYKEYAPTLFRYAEEHLFKGGQTR